MEDPQGQRDNRRWPAIALGVALLPALMAGCFGPEALPPTFRIDRTRHWFEGDHLVVNVTFTNIATFNASASGFWPYIDVILYEERALTASGKHGEETELLASGIRSLRLYFDADPPGKPGSYPWLGRWNRDSTTGPIVIGPGDSLQVEFEFSPPDQFSGDEGYYRFLIDMPAFYPRSMQKPNQGTDDLRFHTGCFNRDIPEFYGWRDPGVDCPIASCFGDETMPYWQDPNEYKENERWVDICGTATTVYGPR